MRARQLPGAAALGLLASLLAHTAAYGGSHAMGGAYHATLVACAAAAGLAALLFATSVAWAGAGSALDGSVMAARLRLGLPSWPVLATATAAWFVLGEHIEAHHDGVAPIVLFVAIALAAWLVLACARAVLSFLAAIVIAIRGGAFAPRILASHRLIVRQAPRARRLLHAQRRYARPPPVAVAGA